MTGLLGSKELLDNSATKGTIHTFTKSLAQNVVDRGVRVNCVTPAPVWTPLNVADKRAREAGEHEEDVPMGRPAQPDEIAPAFVFFASEADSGYITGELLALLGGETTGAWPHAVQSGAISSIISPAWERAPVIDDGNAAASSTKRCKCIGSRRSPELTSARRSCDESQ